jgi:predicted phosphodiesterase
MTPSPKTPRPLETFLEDRAKVRFAENQEIARTARALRATITEQAAELADLRNRLGLHEHLDRAKLEPPTWLTPKGSGKAHRAIPAFAISDWHRGEVVKPEQVDGVNKYTVAIADQRMRRAFEGAVRICRDYIKGMTYEGIELFLPGDLISGSIHEELKETNEQTVAESVVGIVEPLEAGIQMLAQDFGRVHITAVVGNHPRSTRKPIAKNRAQDNMDWLIYQLIARDLRGRKDVTVQVSEAADAHVTIYGTRYLLSHGDQFHGGSGISGILAPLLLGSHRKTRRAAASGRPYDVMVFGHFHQSLWFPSKGLIGCGCGIGYDEWAYVQNLEPEPPQCALWLTTPEHGITINAPVFVQDKVAEGWA